MDETPMKVMSDIKSTEPGRKNSQSSRMWLARGGEPARAGENRHCGMSTVRPVKRNI
jgi:hypothetical protein